MKKVIAKIAELARSHLTVQCVFDSRGGFVRPVPTLRLHLDAIAQTWSVIHEERSLMLRDMRTL